MKRKKRNEKLNLESEACDIETEIEHAEDDIETDTTEVDLNNEALDEEISEKADSEKTVADSDIEFIEIAPDGCDESQDGKKKSRKRKKWLIPAIVAAAVVCAAAVFALIYYNYLFGGAKYTKINEDELNVVEPDDDEESEGIVNIALFGVDMGDDWTNYGRSDSIMIMSVNKKAGTVKLISILRDTKAQIEGYEPQKINAAYQNGGPTLAIKTINSNFHLNIKDFVSVNFGELTKLIDAMGGVDIEITAQEAEIIDLGGIYDENNEYSGQINMTVTEGVAHLNGAQALVYARIRKIDSDYNRADRQHKVLTALLTKVKEMKTTEYPKFIHELMSASETSLDSSDILSLMSVASKKVTLESYTVPDPEFEANLFGGLDETGSWVWIYDLEKASERIKSIIYGTPYVPDTSTDTSMWPSTAAQEDEAGNDDSGQEENYDETEPEDNTETVTAEIIDPEPITEPQTETQTETQTEPQTEIPTEPPTEPITETQPEPTT